MCKADGKSVVIYPGGKRTYSLFGDQFPGSSDGDYAEAVREYVGASAEAGRLLDDMPQYIKQTVWKEWPHGFVKPDPQDLWTNAVFELAWQKHSGSGFAADRYVWHENLRLKVDDLPRVRGDEGPIRKMFAKLLEHAGVPPSYWFSSLNNIWRASIAAIDVILDPLRREVSLTETFSRVQGGMDRALSILHQPIPSHVIEQTIASAMQWNELPDADVLDAPEEARKGVSKLKWLAEAMLLKQEHPDWPDAKIAKIVGRDKSTLSRNEMYQAAKAQAQGDKGGLRKGHVTVDPESGQFDVEAYADSDDPAKRNWDE